MTFLYHHVPADMQGSVLYPLEKLKERAPTLWVKQVKKYEGRQGLLKCRIPPLNCLWGEVLFFSPIHPQKICDALRRAGIHRSMRCFEIPAHLLSKEKTVVMFSEVKEFISYTAEAIELYAEIPQHTIDYYRSCAGEMPFLYHGVPQILHRGTFNIAGLRIVEGR